MPKFSVTFKNSSGKQFVRTTESRTAAGAVQNIITRQKGTVNELREIVSVLEWAVLKVPKTEEDD